MSDFLKGLLATAIPIVALNVTYIFLCVPAIVVAIVAAIVFAARGRRSIANGILAGVGIGVLFLGATCFSIFAGQ
jgi:ABC-type transport system involved in cytochrome bd biosynthesis fused ATPase/permease subunit